MGVVMGEAVKEVVTVEAREGMPALEAALVVKEEMVMVAAMVEAMVEATEVDMMAAGWVGCKVAVAMVVALAAEAAAWAVPRGGHQAKAEAA